MTDSGSSPSPTTVGAGLLLVAGIVLAGAGLSVHVETAGYLSAGACDGCAPWHPLFVVAPLVGGSVLALAGGAVLARD